MVEKPSEYPFFIYEQGWASCQPNMTLSRYGLPCRQLKVGDICIFLSNKLEMIPDKTAANSEAKTTVKDSENQSHNKQYSTAPVPQNTEPDDISRGTTESEGNNLSCENDAKTRQKSFGRKEKNESLGVGQPAGKKAKVDIPSKNIDGKS